MPSPHTLRPSAQQLQSSGTLLCYPVRSLRNQAIDYDNLDTEDFVYEPSQEEIAAYQRISAEMLK